MEKRLTLLRGASVQSPALSDPSLDNPQALYKDIFELQYEHDGDRKGQQQQHPQRVSCQIKHIIRVYIWFFYAAIRLKHL